MTEVQSIESQIKDLHAQLRRLRVRKRVTLPVKIFQRVEAFRDVQSRLGKPMTIDQAMAMLIADALTILWSECRPLNEQEKAVVAAQEEKSELASRGWETK